MFDNHSRINHVDDVILQVFEDSEDDGALYFPVTTQKEARAFVKALHAKGVAYRTFCEEIVEVEQNFTSWRTGLGRAGIGNRVIERINRPIQEMLLAELLDDDVNVEQELPVDAIERVSAVSSSPVVCDESSHRQTAPRDTPSPIDASSSGVNSRSHVVAGGVTRVSDAIQSAHESDRPVKETTLETSADLVMELAGESNDNSIVSSDSVARSPVAVECINDVQEERPVDLNHVQVNDTETSNVEQEIISEEFLVNSQQTEFVLLSPSRDVNHVDSCELISPALESPKTHDTVTVELVSADNGVALLKDDRLVEDSEFVIECAVTVVTLPAETSEHCSDKTSIKTNGSTGLHDEINELILGDATCASVQLADPSPSPDEHDDNDSVVFNRETTQADVHDKILQLQNHEMTNGNTNNNTCEKATTHQNGSDCDMSKKHVNIDENYNSDDELVDNVCTTVSISGRPTVDGPGYVYVFTDTVLSASTTVSDYRIKIGASRHPFSRLRQAALFNVDIRLVSAVSVSARHAASRSVMDQLSGMALSDSTGWFVGRLDSVLDALMNVSRQFPVSLDSEC